ncbi:MAG TPA: GYF domain-containing protein [Polyangiaceae bacterium]|nr:GYF domain-containing protein [Polyangiaceae bacterium]
MSWWVTVPGGHPLGPVPTGRLLRAIAAGKVPNYAYACRVGDEEWTPLTSIPRFADALPSRSLERYGAPSRNERAPFVEPETVAPPHRSSYPPPPHRP